MEKKLPWRGLYLNLISYFGGVLIGLSLLLIVSLFLFSFTQERPSPYIGIFTYVFFPGMLLFGVGVFLFGMWWESRRVRRLGAREPLPLPIFDLNQPQHRRTLGLILVAGGLLAVLLSLSAYNTYLFTDSVAFCGLLCHRVMEPEYTAYQHSPHARVGCVECHVGPGAAWYFRSKVAGVPQLWGTLFRNYPTPIPVPIKNLRPARDTCEHCHWPEYFFGAQLVQIPYFEHDEQNTANQISFLVKTGGGSTKLGENAGIHWHMILNNRIYFRALDLAEQRIPWVKLVRPDGSEVIFRDQSAKLSDEQLKKLPLNLMDCIHCHNRPSHLFPPPDILVDRNLSNGNISPKLPWIKKIGTLALIRNYPNHETASAEIRKSIEDFYSQKYPEVLRTQKAIVDQAVETISAIHHRTVFPQMKVNWQTYPNNIGHRNWPGCFVCHAGRHVSDDGKAINSSCTACHTEAERGPLLPLGATPPRGEEKPWHPISLKGKHAKLLCHECHQQGYPAILGCAECHKIPTGTPMHAMECNTCHLKEQERQPQADCRSCHSQIGELHKKPGHAGSACTACHPPHKWNPAKRDTCLECHGDKKDHNPPELCWNCHPFRGEQKAKPAREAAKKGNK